VAGPLARHVSDLALALDIIAGPDEDYEGTGYRAALPSPRHTLLKDFRVFVIDTHPLVPASAAVRTAVGRLATEIERSGAKVGWASPMLPDLAVSARLYMRLLNAAKSPRAGRDDLMDAERLLQALPSEDHGLHIERARGTLMSHRDWLATDSARRQMQQQWHSFFRDWDVVIYPAAAVPAFPHDHSEPIESRHLDIDGEPYSYYDGCFVWADPASTCGLPATAIPIERSAEGLPIGVQIIGPNLEDRTAIAFAALVERELGGFVPPPFALGGNV
jgi:amidase